MLVQSKGIGQQFIRLVVEGDRVNQTSDSLPSPSDHLVSEYPSTRKVARLLGAVWLITLVLATYAHSDTPPSPWLEYGTVGLMGTLLVGGLALMIACTALVIHGRKRINGRVGLFLFWIWSLPYAGVVIALLRAASRAKSAVPAEQTRWGAPH